MKAELLKSLKKTKQEMEDKTGQTCEIEESEDGHVVKCSGTTSGSNIFSSSHSAGMIFICFTVKSCSGHLVETSVNYASYLCSFITSYLL